MWRHNNCVTARGSRATLRVTYTLRVATLLVATLLVLPAVAAVQVVAQSATPQYSVVELPASTVILDQFRYAVAINDAGQIVGTAHLFGDDQAVLWDHGPQITIGGIPDGGAADINERGQVVWNGQNGGRQVAFVRGSDGISTPLEQVGGSGASTVSNVAFAINDTGQIVGCSAVLIMGHCETAVMWSGGEIIRIGALELNLTAIKINNRGQIIFDSPFLWDNGVMSELPGLSAVTDINDRGEILGLSDGRPVVWAHGIITPLALPPGEWGVSATAINDLGHAVGTIISTAPGALAMAVLWRDGEVIPLPPLVANESTIAYDINNRGEIVGWSQGSRSDLRRALLWMPQTPTTPPSTTPGDVGSAPGTPEALPTDLGTLGGKYSTPTGINENGVIVGSSTTSGKEQHGFAWMPANGMVDLGTFGARSAPGVRLRTSVATAVNNRGEVVGASYVATGAPDSYQAFLWTSSAGMQIIGTPTPGLLSDATAINDVGQVLGNDGGSEVWTATGGWVDIGTLGGGVRPVANNNLGQVVGTSGLGTASVAAHAFMWTASGGMVDLGTLGGPSSAAAAVNQSGSVVGWAQVAGAASDNNWRAFLWTAASGMVNLGSLGGPYSVARDVNETDMVVGTSAVAGNAAVHAFVWTSAAGMRDLGTLGGTDSDAYAVSDTGMVVGRSSTPGDAASHAFVWTPSGGMVDLVPLPGYTDSVAYLVNSTGAVVGSSYDRVSGTYRATMWNVSVTPPSDDWTFCAVEGAVCAFTGTKEVRYGANGSFFFKTLTGGTTCTNAVFGDPAPGTPKECAIRTPSTPPPSDEWTFCATEGGVCAFTGTMDVRYGANGSFVVKTLTDGTACTNAVFGDPAPDMPKECAIRTPSTPPPTDWVFCATEGGVCAFTGTMEVRYGANGSFVVKTLTDGTACTNAVFGDPAPDTPKHCAIRPPSTPPPMQWTFCAPEGGVCAFTGTLAVRYGANGLFVVKTLTGGTACTNQVFGDPAPDVAKSCSLPVTGP